MNEKAYIFNNFINLFTNDNVVAFGILLRNSPYRNVLANTVCISGTNAASQALRIWEATSVNFAGVNNILVNRAGGYAFRNDVITNFVSDYNNFFTSGPYLVDSYAILEEWQVASSKDQNSVSVNPRFISDNDLHIYHSFADLDGIASVVTTGNPQLDFYLRKDMDNETRDASHPDIGADEYTFISEENNFLKYSFAEQTGDAIISTDDHTISAEVEYGTDLPSLIAIFTVSENASVAIGSELQVSGVTVNDFTSPVTYTVTAEDGTEQDWIVIVTEELNDSSDILSYSFVGTTGTANIDADNHIIDVQVAFIVDITQLVSSFTLSTGASAYVGATLQETGVTTNDFTSAVVYTVVAEDGTEQDWTVTVTKALNNKNDILSFSFTEQSSESEIDEENHAIVAYVVPGTDLTSLVASFTLSENATAFIEGSEQVSGVTANDFSSIVMYLIEAEDGSQQFWTITAVTEYKNDFLTFSFAEQTGDAVINAENHTVDIEVAHSTDVTNMIASFSISDEATVSINGTHQESGVTSNDFTAPVTYTITSSVGDQQEWVITVTIALPNLIIENEKTELIVFPNPASDHIYIKCNNDDGTPVFVKLLDTTGKIMTSCKLYADKGQVVRLDLEKNFEPGIYFIKLQTKIGLQTYKLIIR